LPIIFIFEAEENCSGKRLLMGPMSNKNFFNPKKAKGAEGAINLLPVY
jgi:hypothetical protein